MSPTLVLTSDFPPSGGGIARLYSELARIRPEWVVSTPRAGRDVGVPGIAPGEAARGAVAQATRSAHPGQLAARVDRLPVSVRRARTLQGVARWTRRALTLADRFGVDLIHCGNLKPAGPVGAAAGAFRGIPYVLACYGRDVLAETHKARRSWLKRRVLRRVLSGASAMIAPSRWTARQAESLLAAAGARSPPLGVVVVPPGADPSRFHPGLDVRPVRSRYGVPAGPCLLTVARVEPHKGIATVLAALSRLSDVLPLTYLVVGEGRARAALEARAAELGVQHRVRWLGEVPDADLPALYNAATLYVGLSEQQGVEVEGFGLSFLEASASGLPVVAGVSGGVADAVRHGETGLLLPPGDPAALARVLAELLGEPERCRQLGAAGRRAVERYFNWERVCRDLDELYAEVRLERQRRQETALSAASAASAAPAAPLPPPSSYLSTQ